MKTHKKLRLRYGFGAYAGLPDTNGKPRRLFHLESVDHAMEALSRKRGAATASDHGAITVWVGKSGAMHGEYSRYLAVRDKVSTKSTGTMRTWINKTLKRITTK